MVDFKKRLAGKKTAKPIDPVALYDTLDRAHDKGPLRPAQLAVLTEWFENNTESKDVIVKLHTGQGKTLVGLLLLQAMLNQKKGPAVYLCPDNFLIDQTCEQAKQFGIATCKATVDLPNDFLDGNQILITSVQKLFNGLTHFGLKHKSVNVGALLMDDAHACVDRIRQACSLRIENTDPAYHAIVSLFAQDLEQQGVGTYADICNKERDAQLPVPYWGWLQRETEVAKILSDYSKQKSIKFAWPLLKDMLAHCQCVVSGAALEIEPYIAPLAAFGSYWKAEHRIFMSATVTDDAFLVKGLQLKPETIIKPITYNKESWSGEKMILLPSLIDEEFTHDKIVEKFSKPNDKNKAGIVALLPSFSRTKDWHAYGSFVADKTTLPKIIDDLRTGEYERTVVLANRYDGIDLPDNMCRILIFDGRPYSENLIDLNQESCRPNSEATLMRTIRSVEQGLGRSVRGEKDYSVVIITGADITRLVRDRKSREYLSPQMSAQIGIGLELAEMAQQEIEEGEKPEAAFNGLIRQCLSRDDDWKAFYIDQMTKVKPASANEHILHIYAVELEAEQCYGAGDYSGASDKIQSLLDNGKINTEDKSWYLQEMARYNYVSNRPEFERLQIAAHKGNHLLLKPPSGVTVAKLTIVSHGRVERISKWVSNFEEYSQLDIHLSDILAKLVFGTKADKFENALDELSEVLGFVGERPDKEWKEGPDNLWAIDSTKYIVWECKNEVKTTRSEINKREAEQMNRSSSWFEKHYPGMTAKRIIIHPASKVESAAAFTHKVEVMRLKELRFFVKSVREFFKSFEEANFQDLSATQIQRLLNLHNLSINDLLKIYSKKVKNLKSH